MLPWIPGMVGWKIPGMCHIVVTTTWIKHQNSSSVLILFKQTTPFWWPKGQVDRYETGQLQRPQYQPAVRVKNPLYDHDKMCFKVKWVGAPSCINHTACHVAMVLFPVVEVILLKNINRSLLTVEAVANKVLWGDNYFHPNNKCKLIPCHCTMLPHLPTRAVATICL